MWRPLEWLTRRLRRPPVAESPPAAILPLFPRRPAPVAVVAAPEPEPLPPYAELRDVAGASTPTNTVGFSPGAVTRLTLYPAEPPNLLRPLLPNTAEFAEDWIGKWHQDGGGWPSRDAPCYFATDAIVSGSGQIWLGGKLVTDEALLAPYVYRLNLGLPESADTFMQVTRLPVRDIAEPCVVMPGGANIFGHFLIETMFYVLSIRERGLDCRYLLPDTAAPWLVRMLCDDLGLAPGDLVFYRPEIERVRLRQAILPAMLHRGDGFHPVAGVLIEALLARLDVPAPLPATPRVFLTRAGFHRPGAGGRECSNELELVEYARSRHRFVAVSMQDLSWREQIALMRDAKVVVGLFGSALHATLFSPPGTRVACLGFGNLVQSEISALRKHDMAYMTKGFVASGVYAIDLGDFGRFLDAVCEAGV